MTTLATSRPTTAGDDRVVDELSRLLADTFTLYLKTHGYHWNVSGPGFPSLHALFEEQYVDLRDAVDEIAERIRARGRLAPGSWRQLEPLARIAEDATVPEAEVMVGCLAEDHEIVAATARDVLRAADEAEDAATADLATRRIGVHDKARWMLRASLPAGPA